VFEEERQTKRANIPKRIRASFTPVPREAIIENKVAYILKDKP